MSLAGRFKGMDIALITFFPLAAICDNRRFFLPTYTIHAYAVGMGKNHAGIVLVGFLCS